jgi:hypothetical protein
MIFGTGTTDITNPESRRKEEEENVMQTASKIENLQKKIYWKLRNQYFCLLRS